MTEEMGRVAELARRLHSLYSHVGSGLAFYAYGMIILGAILVVNGLGLYTCGFCYLVALISGVVVATLTLWRAIPYPRSERGYLIGVSFGVSFALIYALSLLWRDFLALLGYAPWYLTLGIASLLTHVLFERDLIESGRIKAKPFLVVGVLIVATQPLVTYVGTSLSEMNAHILASGLTLLIYFTGGTYSLIVGIREFK